MLASGKKILISGPPQSGKSAMAQLFKRYVDFAKLKIEGLADLEVVHISFSGYNNQTTDTLETLERYLNAIYGNLIGVD